MNKQPVSLLALIPAEAGILSWLVALMAVTLLVPSLIESELVAQYPTANVVVEVTDSSGRGRDSVRIDAIDLTGARHTLAPGELQSLPLSRYEITVSSVGAYTKRRILELWSTEEAAWIVPQAHVRGAAASSISGTVMHVPEDFTVWVKLVSIPEFEELRDQRPDSRGSFQFDNVHSGVYALLIVGYPRTYGRTRLLFSREVIVCGEQTEVSLDMGANILQSLSSECEAQGVPPPEEREGQ